MFSHWSVIRVSFTNCQQLLLLTRRQRIYDIAILLTAIRAVHGRFKRFPLDYWRVGGKLTGKNKYVRWIRLSFGAMYYLYTPGSGM